MADIDRIYPGQTWAPRSNTRAPVRINVVDDKYIGFTRPYDHGATTYMSRRKFLATYHRPAA